jgi:hypothetical protein
MFAATTPPLRCPPWSTTLVGRWWPAGKPPGSSSQPTPSPHQRSTPADPEPPRLDHSPPGSSPTANHHSNSSTTTPTPDHCRCCRWCCCWWRAATAAGPAHSTARYTPPSLNRPAATHTPNPCYSGCSSATATHQRTAHQNRCPSPCPCWYRPKRLPPDQRRSTIPAAREPPPPAPPLRSPPGTPHSPAPTTTDPSSGPGSNPKNQNPRPTRPRPTDQNPTDQNPTCRTARPTTTGPGRRRWSPVSPGRCRGTCCGPTSGGPARTPTQNPNRPNQNRSSWAGHHHYQRRRVAPTGRGQTPSCRSTAPADHPNHWPTNHQPRTIRCHPHSTQRRATGGHRPRTPRRTGH